VTSNKPFELWGDMFADSILATAVLDRLVHRAHIVPITGESYRTKDRRPPQPSPPGKAARAGKTAPLRWGHFAYRSRPVSLTVRIWSHSTKR